jgi:hypothetical protein
MVKVSTKGAFFPVGLLGVLLVAFANLSAHLLEDFLDVKGGR